MIAPDFIRDPAHFSFQPMGAVFIWGGAIFVYAVGLLVFGAPAWLILHALGLRSWRAAIALGLVLNGGVIPTVRKADSRRGIPLASWT